MELIWGEEHDYTSCDDKNLNNRGYNNCRRCTELQLDNYDKLSVAVGNLITQKGRHNTQLAYDKLVVVYNKQQGK